MPNTFRTLWGSGTIILSNYTLLVFALLLRHNCFEHKYLCAQEMPPVGWNKPGASRDGWVVQVGLIFFGVSWSSPNLLGMSVPSHTLGARPQEIEGIKMTATNGH